MNCLYDDKTQDGNQNQRRVEAKLRQLGRLHREKIMINGQDSILRDVSNPSPGCKGGELSLNADDARQAALDVRLGLAHTSTTWGFSHQSSIQKDPRNKFCPRLFIERALFRR